MLLRIDFAKMVQQRGERPGVGVSIGFAEGGEYAEKLAAAILDQREPGGVFLDPERCVARDAVLPASEPEQAEPQIVIARIAKQAVENGEIEMSLFRLDLLPSHGRQNGVEVHGGKLGPDGLHVFDAGRGRIADFTTKDEKWFAVHDELRSAAVFFQMGNSADCPGLLTRDR